MLKFYVGCFISDGVNLDQEANEWFRSENREMSDWINETAGDRWSLEYFVDWSGGDEYNTRAMNFCDIFVEYQDERNAVLHKLRWG